MKELITVKEAGDIMCCSYSWILRHKSDLGCAFRVGKKIKIDKHKLINYIESNKTTTEQCQLKKKQQPLLLYEFHN